MNVMTKAEANEVARMGDAAPIGQVIEALDVMYAWKAELKLELENVIAKHRDQTRAWTETLIASSDELQREKMGRINRTSVVVPNSTIGLAVHQIVEELLAATKSNGAFNSPHEGFAVLLEEVDELKEQVWLNPKKRDIGKMRKEAIQVAAMGLRFMLDCCAQPEPMNQCSVGTHSGGL